MRESRGKAWRRTSGSSVMGVILSDPLASFADVFTDIETDRLLLRPLHEADRRAMVDIHTDPRTNRFHPDPPDVPRASAMFSEWLGPRARDRLRHPPGLGRRGPPVHR